MQISRFAFPPFRRWLLAGALLPGGILTGDEILFTNGDRLHGTVLGMDADTVRFQSERFGELSVPRTAITSLETAFETPDSDPAAASDSSEPSPAPETPAPRSLMDQTSNFVVGMIRPYSPFGWSGTIALGADLERSESTETAIRFNLDATKTLDENEYSTGLYYEFKETEESTDVRVTDTDRYGGYFGYTRTLPYQFLLTGDTRAFANQVQEVDFQYDAALLIGKRFTLLDDLILRLDIGRTATYLNPAFGQAGWSYLWEFRERIDFRPGDAFRFEQSFRYQIDPSDTDREAYIWDVSAILRMNEWVNTVLKYEFEHSTLATSGPTEEERLSASLAFPF